MAASFHYTAPMRKDFSTETDLHSTLNPLGSGSFFQLNRYRKDD